MQNCVNAFVRQILYVQASKLVLKRTCDSKRGHSYHSASTRNFQHVCVNEFMSVLICACMRVSILL
jgi:hypothetical protein